MRWGGGVPRETERRGHNSGKDEIVSPGLFLLFHQKVDARHCQNVGLIVRNFHSTEILSSIRLIIHAMMVSNRSVRDHHG